MTTGILKNIDGRKLLIAQGEVATLVYLRKGQDSAEYLPLLMSNVDVETVEEKGFQMVVSIKPTVPVTAAEQTKPVDMPPSANVPKLQFGSGFQTVGSNEKATVPVKPNFDPKQKLITASWAMGAVLNSQALAGCNDSLALNTQQTMERAKKLATELILWVGEQAAK